MNYKQLSLGFKDELDKRESEYLQVNVTRKITKKTVNHLIKLYEHKALLPHNDLNWCFRISKFAKENKRLSLKQASVIECIYDRMMFARNLDALFET